MAASKAGAHDVVTCDLCDKSTKQFCNSCQVSLCETCVEEHRDEFKSLSHEIVYFLERKSQLVFPGCKDHPGQRCEVHCNNCDGPVCVKCILSGPHKGHDVEELIETFERRRQETKRKTAEIKEKILPKCMKEDTDNERAMSRANSQFDDLGKECKSLRQSWHQEVDDIFDKMDFLSKTFKDQNLNRLRAYKNEIQNVISDINETLERNDKVLQSNKLSDINNYLSNLNKVANLPKNPDITMPHIEAKMNHEKELNLEMGNFKATLTQSSEYSHSTDAPCLTPKTAVLLMDEVKVISTIPTNFDNLCGISCVGEAEGWVFGEHDNNISRIDMQGSVNDIVSTGPRYGPKAISVSNEGKLLYSISEEKLGSVKLVRTGWSEQLIIAPPWWTPEQLCCTRSGDILLNEKLWHWNWSGNIPKDIRIVRYHNKEKSQEINKDRNGVSIFMKGPRSLYMSENNNGDICVSDSNDRSVVVVNQTGRVRFRYDGVPARRKRPFDPRDIVTDAYNQIILTDYSNNCLHILDQNGQFLKCVEGCGLENPKGLSLDRKGRLWVGTKSKSIKIIKYMAPE
ncbi:uncharacterized protein LOC111111534 isoform X3 [Crassostrea virginica]